METADNMQGWFEYWKFSLRVDATQNREPYRIPLQFTSVGWEYNRGLGVLGGAEKKTAPSKEDLAEMGTWNVRCAVVESAGASHEPIPAARLMELSSSYSRSIRSFIPSLEQEPELIAFQNDGYRKDGSKGDLSPGTDYTVHCAVFEEKGDKSKLKGSVVSVAARTADAPSFDLLTGVLDSGPPGLYPFQVGVALASEQERILVGDVLGENFKDSSIRCVAAKAGRTVTRQEFSRIALKEAYAMTHEGGGFLLLDHAMYDYADHLREDSKYGVHCAVYRRSDRFVEYDSWSDTDVAARVVSPVQSIEARTGSIMPVLKQPPRSAGLFEVLLELEKFEVNTPEGDSRQVDVAELSRWVSGLQLRCASSLHELGKGSTSLQADWIKLHRSLNIDKYSYKPEDRFIEFSVNMSVNIAFTAKVGNNTRIEAGRQQREIEYLTGYSGYESAKEFVEFSGDNNDGDLSFLDRAGTFQYEDDGAVIETLFKPIKHASEGWAVTISSHGQDKQRLSPGTSYYTYCGLVNETRYGNPRTVGSLFQIPIETALDIEFSLRSFESKAYAHDWELPYRVKAPVFDDLQMVYSDGGRVDLGSWNVHDRPRTADFTRNLEAQCVLFAGELQVQDLSPDDLLKWLSSHAAAGRVLSQGMDTGSRDNAHPVLLKMDGHFGPIVPGADYTSLCGLVVDDDGRRRVAILGEVKAMKLTAPRWGNVEFQMTTDFAPLYMHNYDRGTREKLGTFEIGVWITELRATGGEERGRGAKLDLTSPTEEGQKLCKSIRMQKWCLAHTKQNMAPEEFLKIMEGHSERRWGTRSWQPRHSMDHHDMCYKLYDPTDKQNKLDYAITFDEVVSRGKDSFWEKSITDEESNYVSCAIVDGSPSQYWLASELHTARANEPAKK